MTFKTLIRIICLLNIVAIAIHSSLVVALPNSLTSILLLFMLFNMNIEPEEKLP